ncbi:MAG TPA: DUF4331 domain-containing protein [Acidimicrobiales bacterium]|nr:DUF4331 domain-containing protein [Acidimicrobiales bacterium]
MRKSNPDSSGRHVRRDRVRRALVGAATLSLVVSGSSALLGAGVSNASSHREAPLIGGDPRADNTDVYAFVSPDKSDTVTLLANWIPFEEPNGGPNFYPFATDAKYNINIDNDGDGVADVVYSWVFTNHTRDDSGQFLYNTGVVNSVKDTTLNFYQTYELTKTEGTDVKSLVKEAVAAPSNVGAASMPNYASLRNEAIKSIDGGGKTFAGQADDSFFLDLRVFDLLYGTDLKEAGTDTLTGYNVNTIGLQVPKKEVAAKGNEKDNPVIGVWSTTLRKGASVFSAAEGAATKDGFVQVSRLGNPLVNEVVVPLKYKDAFNGLTPDKDHTVMPVVDKVLTPILPALIEKIYKIPAPAAPRNDLFEIYLTGICKECKAPDGNVALPIDLNSQQLNKDGKKGADFVPAEELRLNMSIAPTANPNRLGVLAKDLAGFPNGRRLADDIVDISIQAVEGAAQSGKLVEALAAGDGVNENDVAFSRSFPYVALPHGSSVNEAAGGSKVAGASTSSQAAAPAGGVSAGAGGSSHNGLPVAPLTAALGGVLLSVAGLLSIRRRQTV